MAFLSFVLGSFCGVFLGILIIGMSRQLLAKSKPGFISPAHEELLVPPVGATEGHEATPSLLKSRREQLYDLRSQKRFRAKSGAIAAFFPPTSEHSFLLAQIQDISRTGLALNYFSDRERRNVSPHLRIIGPSRPFFTMDGVPGKIVYDMEIPTKDKNSPKSRRCGVKFGELTRSQLSQLDHFIANYTADEI